MSSISRHHEALNKAAQLFDNGYSASYIYEKLLKEGFSEEEAKASVETLTQKPLEEDAESMEAGFFSPRNFLIMGFLVLLLGLALSLILPVEWRLLAYGILIAGPLIILLGAFRANS